jgi:hypothetical protein
VSDAGDRATVNSNRSGSAGSIAKTPISVRIRYRLAFSSYDRQVAQLNKPTDDDKVWFDSLLPADADAWAADEGVRRAAGSMAFER